MPSWGLRGLVSTGRAEKCKEGSSSAVVWPSWGHRGWVCAAAAGTTGSLRAPRQAPGAGLRGLSPCAGLWGELGVRHVSVGQRCEVLRLLAPWHHMAGGACAWVCMGVRVHAASPGALRVAGGGGGPARGAAGVSPCPCVPVRTRLRCCHRAAGAAAPPQCVGSRRGAACIRQRCHGAGGSQPLGVGSAPRRGAGGRCWVRAEPCRPSVPRGMHDARSHRSMTLIRCPSGHEGGRIRPRRRARGANPG